MNLENLNKKHKKLNVKVNFGAGVEVLDVDAVLGNPKPDSIKHKNLEKHAPNSAYYEPEASK